jgi:hypothetical protein
VVWKVVDWNRWREHTVEYDEYQAKVKYGICLASTNYIATGEKGVVQDLDVGSAVRALSHAKDQQPSNDPFRAHRYTAKPKPNGGKQRRW